VTTAVFTVECRRRERRDVAWKVADETRIVGNESVQGLLVEHVRRGIPGAKETCASIITISENAKCEAYHWRNQRYARSTAGERTCR
jgi:hypothetical protein